MLSNIQRILRPGSVEEAVWLLREGGGALKPMAGGTATSAFASPRVEGVVDLWTLPLRYVSEQDGGLRIGATATFGDLTRSRVVRRWAGGALWEAARSAGSTPLRNLFTVGGNIVGSYPWCDLPPALLVLDATLEIAGPAGPERGIEGLTAQHPSKVLGAESIVTEVVLPRPAPASGSAFVKFGESEVDYAWLDVAAMVEMDGALCRRCRFAVGAIEARSRRLEAVEDFVCGAELDEETARAAGELASSLVRPMPDPRSSVEYRRAVLRVLAGRVLLAARDRAREAGAGGGA